MFNSKSKPKTFKSVKVWQSVKLSQQRYNFLEQIFLGGSERLAEYREVRICVAQTHLFTPVFFVTDIITFDVYTCKRTFIFKIFNILFYSSATHSIGIRFYL